MGATTWSRHNELVLHFRFLDMTTLISISLVAFLLLNPSLARILPARKLDKANQCTINIDVQRCHIGGLDLSLVSPESEQWWTWTVEEHLNSIKILLNCSNATTNPLNLDRCLCKHNHTGEKCDTCADGYHMRYIWSKPADHPLKSNTVKHSIRPNKKQFRIYDCKACNCYSPGSKSHICDKKNGSCSCLDGYRGNKCDICSSGHYNDSLTSDSLGGLSPAPDHGRGSKMGRCLKCDDCYDQWYSVVSDLKLSSVDLIKRTYGLAESSASDLGLHANLGTSETPESRGLKRTVSNEKGKVDRLVELEEKLAIIGGIALINKQNKDRINLLSTEINCVTQRLHDIKTEFREQERLKGNVIDRLAQLTLRLRIEADTVEELDALTRKMFKFGVEAQHSSPGSVLQLMKERRDKSKDLMAGSLKYHHRYRDDLKELQDMLEIEVGIGRERQARFEEIGSNLIEESMKTNQIDVSSVLLTSIDFSEARLLQSLRGVGEATLIDWVVEQSRVYLDGFEGRESDLKSIDRLIEGASELLNKTDLHMMIYLADLTTLLDCDSIGANISDSSGLLKGFLQLYRVNSDRLTTSLEKLDEGWSLAQQYLSDLAKSKSTMTKKFLEFSRNLNETLELNSAELRNFTRVYKVEIEELKQLNDKTEMMLIDLNRRNNDSITASRFEQYANLTLSQTKEIHIKTQDELSGLMLSLDAETRDIRSEPGRSSTIHSEFFEISTSVCENCTSKLKLLQERSARLQLQSELERADTRRRIGSSRTQMNQVSLVNEALSMDLRECHHNLTKLGFVIEGDKTDNTMIANTHSASAGPKAGPVRSEETGRTSDAAEAAFSSKLERLSHHSRACNLINGYQDIERRLFKILTRTESLGEEFSLNEQTLSRQRRTLNLLHSEMDRLIEDIRDNVEPHEQSRSSAIAVGSTDGA